MTRNTLRNVMIVISRPSMSWSASQEWRKDWNVCPIPTDWSGERGKLPSGVWGRARPLNHFGEIFAANTNVNFYYFCLEKC